ncbi:hypothetical protein ACN28E_13045 [Archangium lansingense]|uniref:hypothetical protein n=1 Tax=Archangium lansingense TaxID=2995310 RepID=UPI003B767DA1
MQELRGAVTELRGEVETFGAGVGTHVKGARAQLESLVNGVVATIASIRPDVETVVSGLSSRIEALDTELAGLEP